MPEITIRQLAASDRRAVAFTFGRLSERSRYQRYFTTKPTLAPRELARLVDVDHWHHEALIASSPPPRAPIGIAHYVRREDDFEAAEVAITIVDDWQRHGVGTALLAALTDRAARAGIRRFHMSMLRDNVGARALASQLGRPVAAAGAGSVVEFVFDLGWMTGERVDHAPHPPHPGPVGVSSTSIVDETPHPC